MTDVFQTGTFSGPQALWDKLDPLIQSAGWTVRATPEVGVERVYYSDGEDGYSDHYMKMQHKLEDELRTSRGYVQWADDDGYTDYVNFLGYQWYPNAGGSNDGYGEIGRFGPRMYTQLGYASADVRWTNMGTASSGDHRWTDFATNFAGAVDDTGGQAFAFDGHRYLYHTYDPNNTYVYRYDISNGTDTYVATIVGGARCCNLTCSYIRELDRTILFYGTESASSGVRAGVMEFDRNGTLLSNRGIADPWGSTGFQYGCSAAFGRYIYAWRGINTNQVARWDYLTDTWTAVTSMPATGWAGGCGAVITTKEQTGLANHRIYTHRGQSTTTVYYMDLDDDGLPASGWTAAAASPYAPSAGIGYEWDGKDRIHYWPGQQGVTNREYYYYKISTNTWHLVNANFVWAGAGQKSNWRLHDSYQSRVRAFSGEAQKYWFFGNKDRIAIITKSEADQYFFCYAGGIDSYFDDSIREPITGAVSAGAGVVVPMADTSKFSVDQIVQIADFTGNAILISTSALTDRTVQYLASEHTTVASIVPNTSITLTNLNNDYPVGALVGQDLQNFMVTSEQTRYMQTTNLPNTTNDSASGDPGEQVYVYEPGVESTISGKADLNARTQQFIVWPLVIFTEGSNNRFSGKEVRGQLHNTFMMGTGAGSSEDIVEINGASYLVFDMAAQQQEYLLAFGPVL